ENAENAEGGAPINMEDKSQADVDPEKAEDTPDDKQAEEDTEGGDEKRDEGEQPTEEQAEEGEKPEEEEPLDYSVLKDCKVNKAGNVVNSTGDVVGHVSEGKIKELVGRKPDENGVIWNDSGKVLGKAEPVPQEEEAKEHAPFEDFPDAVIESDGTVTFEGSVIGRVIE